MMLFVLIAVFLHLQSTIAKYASGTEATAAVATARTMWVRPRLTPAATMGIAVSTLIQNASAKVSAGLGANTAVADNDRSRITVVDGCARRQSTKLPLHTTTSAYLLRCPSNLFRCRRRKQIPLCDGLGSPVAVHPPKHSRYCVGELDGFQVLVRFVLVKLICQNRYTREVAI